MRRQQVLKHTTRACGKFRYETRAAAESSRRAFNAKRDTSEPAVKVYGCVECGGFHLTSQEGRG